MIITKLIGGLGNQMFQYAAGFKVTHDLNTELKLDITSFQHEGVTKRNYELDIFSISLEIATHQEIDKLKFNPQGILKKSPKIIKLVERATGKSRIFDRDLKSLTEILWGEAMNSGLKIQNSLNIF